MRTTNRKLLLAMMICLLAAGNVFARGVRIGDMAPDFELTLSTGNKIKLSSLRGKAVMLHFWATWCPPCQKEMPEMETLSKKLEAQGNASRLSLLAICISDTEKSRDRYMKKNGFTFSGGLDAEGNIAEVYGVEGIPASILISPSGKIEKINVGMMTSTDLAEFVSAYAD